MLALPVTIFHLDLHPKARANWVLCQSRIAFHIKRLREGLALRWSDVPRTMLATNATRVVNLNNDAGVS